MKRLSILLLVINRQLSIHRLENFISLFFVNPSTIIATYVDIYFVLSFFPSTVFFLNIFLRINFKTR